MPREKTIAFRVDTAEYRELERIAAGRGLRVSEYARAKLLYDNDDERTDLEQRVEWLERELSRLRELAHG